MPLLIKHILYEFVTLVISYMADSVLEIIFVPPEDL